jgi:hypothetical protein
LIGTIEPAQAAEIVNRVLQDFQPQDHGAVSPQGPFWLLMSARVRELLAMASSTHDRAAPWNALRPTTWRTGRRLVLARIENERKWLRQVTATTGWL